jgi:hypothetical protein
VAKQTAPARNAYSLPPKDRNKSGDLITRYRITGPDRLNSIATDHTSQLGIYLAIGNLRIKPLLSSRLNVLRSLPQGPIDIDQETKVINGPRASKHILGTTNNYYDTTTDKQSTCSDDYLTYLDGQQWQPSH